MNHSLVQRIVRSDKPFVLFHTHAALREAIENAIILGKSMDLDICIDDFGNPYLGHSTEYYEKSGEIQPESMPYSEAIKLLRSANIPLIVDCKHYLAWPIIENVINQLGAHRCLVHSFITELKFDYDSGHDDYHTEWSSVKRLTEIKNKFPSVTLSASCKFLPSNLLISPKYEGILKKIRDILKKNAIDTVCLNIPDNTMSDKIIDFFLKEKILPHVGIDNIETSKLSRLYVGETNILSAASNSKLLGY